MNNLVVGLGNCGCQIVKAISNSKTLSDVKLYAVDSTTASIDMSTITSVETIPIISDEYEGSGRNRARGCAMFEYHDRNGAFEKLYKDAENAKAPVIVISSAAGGTGSGSIVPLCKRLLNKDIDVIPVIIAPDLKDPDAYHLNTSDLMIELQDIGVKTYSIFRNKYGDADYTSINLDVVKLIEIIFGKDYDRTTRDSIDDADLKNVLSVPGRFIALSVEAKDINVLQKEIIKKVFSGSQPAWTEEEANSHTFMKAYSLKSMFANTDFDTVFKEVNARIPNAYDEYRNIVADDNDGTATATLIISGLPRPEMKIVDTDFMEAKGIGEGMNRSKRPSFMNRKKSEPPKDTDGDKDLISQFKWY